MIYEGKNLFTEKKTNIRRVKPLLLLMTYYQKIKLKAIRVRMKMIKNDPESQIQILFFLILSG